MRVRAIANRGDDLPASIRSAGIVRPGEEFPITVGREYTVFALSVSASHVFFHIVDDDQHPWPHWTPGPLFEVTDPRLSRYWTFGYRPRPDDARTGMAIAGATFAFPEWIDQLMFEERLIDNEEPEASIFARYQPLMESEFD